MTNAFEIENMLDQAAAARQQGDKVRAATLYLQAGNLLAEAGDHDNAIIALSSGAALESDTGNSAQAEKTLRRALDLARKHVPTKEAQILCRLGQSLVSLGRGKEAIPFFSRLIVLEQQANVDVYTSDARAELKKLGA